MSNTLVFAGKPVLGLVFGLEYAERQDLGSSFTCRRQRNVMVVPLTFPLGGPIGIPNDHDRARDRKQPPFVLFCHLRSTLLNRDKNPTIENPSL